MYKKSRSHNNQNDGCHHGHIKNNNIDVYCLSNKNNKCIPLDCCQIKTKCKLLVCRFEKKNKHHTTRLFVKYRTIVLNP